MVNRQSEGEMMRYTQFLIVLMLFFAAIFMLAVPAKAEEMVSQANVLDVTGEVTFQKAGGADWTSLEKGMVLEEGDSIKTAEASEAKIEIMGERKTAELTVREAASSS